VREDIDLHKNSVLRKIYSTVSKLEEGSLSFNYGGRPVRAQKSDIVRVLSHLSFLDKAEIGIRNIILEAVMTSESISPGAGFLCLKMFFEKDSIEIKETFHRVEKETIFKSMRNLIGNGVSSKIVRSILDKSSVDARIKVSPSEMAFRPVVRSSPSLVLNGHLSEMFSTKKNEITEAGVIFLDGVLESVSEIDSLLQTLSRDKKNFVIFARGFSPEVSHTLSENHSSRRLYVFPIVLKGDLEYFERFSDHQGFFNIENHVLMRTLTSESFDFCHDVKIRQGTISITGLYSSERDISVSVPFHLKSVLGVLEDRVSYSMIHAKETGFYGSCVLSKDLGVFSSKCFKVAKRSASSLRKSLDNTNCLVLQEN